MRAQLVIPAAGLGTRLGLERPKALVEVCGKPLLVHTLERFVGLGLVGDAVVVVPPGYASAFEDVLGAAFEGVSFCLIDGGAERQESVERALEALDEDTELVVIHDAARPFVSEDSVRESLAAAEAFGAATVAIPSIDTILEVDDSGLLVRTPERRGMWACQTPQTFRAEVIVEAHRKARAEGLTFTDDASLVSCVGVRAKMVMGTRLNFKVTTPTDLALAEWVIREGAV